MLSNPHVKTAAALAVALAAISPSRSHSQTNRQPTRTTTTPSQATPIVRVIAPQNGFDWGDAGIGAAGGLALSMLGVGAALAISQRRTRDLNSPAAPTS